MKTIWKFELSGKIEMPRGAKILSAGCQHNKIMIWAEVDTEFADKEPRYFVVIGTGDRIRTDMVLDTRIFLGTVLLYDGDKVWHIYEKKLAL